MSEPNLDELDESIQLLVNYRDRLKKEVTAIANKLQMPQSRINSTLIENSELVNINKTLKHLKSKRQEKISQKKF